MMMTIQLYDKPLVYTSKISYILTYYMLPAELHSVKAFPTKNVP